MGQKINTYQAMILFKEIANSYAKPFYVKLLQSGGPLGPTFDFALEALGTQAVQLCDPRPTPIRQASAYGEWAFITQANTSEWV